MLAPYNGRPATTTTTTSTDDSNPNNNKINKTKSGRGKGETQPIYIAIRRKVYDVTPSSHFYGPTGPYAIFAGRDASRLLATGRLDPDEDPDYAAAVRRKTRDGKELDDLDDLNVEEQEALRGWEEMFEVKYAVVGRLVGEEEMRRIEAGERERRAAEEEQKKRSSG